METTKTNESATAAGKTVNDTNTAMMDMYSKQLNLATGFYTNLFNTMMGGNKGISQGMGSMDMFQNNPFTKLFSNPFSGAAAGIQNPFAAYTNTDFTKAFSNPFNAMGAMPQNPFQSSFEKMFSQLADFNHNLFSAFTNDAKNNTDWNEISKKYKDTIDSRLEASKNMLQSATEAYNKQMASSTDVNKKMMEDINTQFNSIVKQTQKFWSDALNMNKSGLTEADLNIKEPSPADFKKRANAPVTEFMDHKG